MAKSKNHTNHNQNYKDHRHPIRIKGKGRPIGEKGLEQKLRKNRIKSRKAEIVRRRNEKAKKEGNKATRPPKKNVKFVYRNDKFDLQGLQKLKKTVPVWKAKNIRAKKTSEKKTAAAPAV